MPNAGKSTLLSVLTKALPKIAAYPFTTLNPYVGMIPFSSKYDQQQVSMADLPGLIEGHSFPFSCNLSSDSVEGAHRNRGLGHKFLKHIERTKAICYVIDMSAELRDPYDDYITLKNELNIF